MAANFSVVKKGYDQKEVDFYISRLESELKEYQEKEYAISKALINAEAASKQKLEDANEKARGIMEQIRNELNEEVAIVEKMINDEKKALEDFCSEYDTLVKNYFTGSAFEITAPLREKLNLLECIIAETKNSKPDPDENGGFEEENAENNETQ